CAPPLRRTNGPVTAASGHAALRRSPGVRWEPRACSGGHKGRPYDAPSTWSVGASISRPTPCAGQFECRTRPKPPLGDQGEVAGRRPDGGDQRLAETGADNPSVSLREPAPFAQGSLPSQVLGPAAFGEGAVEIAGLLGRP